MIYHYLKVAARNLIRHRSFSALNVLGLALGIASSLLILLWVQDERRFDGFHANGKNLFQVYLVHGGYPTQGLLARELKRAFPEISNACPFEGNYTYHSSLGAGGKALKVAGTYAGPDFFRMFSFPLLLGTPESALGTPGGIAISRRTAEQFFGSPQAALGQTLRYENREDLLVTAVFENVPAHSSLQFDFLRSWEAYLKENQWALTWDNLSPYTFVQLRGDADPARVEAKIRDFVYRYRPRDGGPQAALALQPFTERYLHATFKDGRFAGGRIGYVRLFSLVAGFVLLTACINFMNLATARSAKRAKEVGVRKVAGAVRTALVGQFVGEALLLTTVAAGVALLLVQGLLPPFNGFTGKSLVLPVGQPAFWAGFAGLVGMTGLVAGSYPALFLSSLPPIRVLKGSFRPGSAAGTLRKGLVVFQFALSVVLIVGTVVMYRQMTYISTKNLGYNRENLLYISIEGELARKYALFKEAAARVPGVGSISRMRHSPTVIDHSAGDISWEGKDPNASLSIADVLVGYDFVKTMQLELRAGRDFSRAFGADSAGFLVNESAARLMGYRDPIGKPLTWGDDRGTIIGVLKDFHFKSMHEAITPLVIRLNEQKPFGTILVRTRPGGTAQALAGLEKVCKALNPGYPFTYQFSDEEFAKLYRSERLVGRLFNGFAGLAIFISCLGLLGLAMFTAEQRVKEIGIRKVLGASVVGLVLLLCRDFLKLVGIAILVASPLAWYAGRTWLGQFAYRVDLEWWVFGLAGGLAVVVALLTISVQSTRAALADPVKSLRSE